MTTPQVQEVSTLYARNLQRLRTVRAVVADMRMVLCGCADAYTVEDAPIRVSFGCGHNGTVRAGEVLTRFYGAGIAVERIDWQRRYMMVTL